MGIQFQKVGCDNYQGTAKTNDQRRNEANGDAKEAVGEYGTKACVDDSNGDQHSILGYGFAYLFGNLPKANAAYGEHEDGLKPAASQQIGQAEPGSSGQKGRYISNV